MQSSLKAFEEDSVNNGAQYELQVFKCKIIGLAVWRLVWNFYVELLK